MQKLTVICLSGVMGFAGCQTPCPKPSPAGVSVAQAKASVGAASTAVRAAIEDSKETTTEIKRIKTTQDRVDAKSILILKWLEFQR